MGRASRDKGKRGERELAAYLRERGFEASRGVQHRGGPDSPDVLAPSLPFHVECKRTERLSVYDAMQQAVEDAGDRVPIVAHRRNGREWLAVLRLADFLDLVGEGST